MQNAIELLNVSKTYKNGRKEIPVQAIKNISLSVEQGDYIALCGVSGSGKTTLLNLMGCIDLPTSGEIYIEGKRVDNLNQRERAKIRNSTIGFVIQDFGLIPYRSAFENVMLPLLLSNGNNKNHKEKAENALSAVNALSFSARRAGLLSGGQKQRVAIARALVNDPNIILADEPTGSLDSKTKNEIVELLQQINKTGKTIVVVTHDKAIASSAKRVIDIRDGVVF